MNETTYGELNKLISSTRFNHEYKGRFYNNKTNGNPNVDDNMVVNLPQFLYLNHSADTPPIGMIVKVEGRLKYKRVDRTTFCMGCKKIYETVLDRCSRCKMVHYCDVECQKKDWKSHKVKCKSPHN